MPFALIIIGTVLLVSSVRNTQGDLYTLVKGDFTGDNNYLYWMVSILVIGAVGYIPTLKPLSRMFLGLVILVLFLSHGGIFEQLNAQLFGTRLDNSVAAGSTFATGLENFQSGLENLLGQPMAQSSSGSGNWIDNFNYGANGLETPLAPARPN